MPVKYALPEAPPDEYAPVLDFGLFMSHVFDWKQNQHVAVIGPTEQGKTNLVHNLLARRSYVAYLCIKSRDATLDAFAKSGGYTRIRDWPPMTGRGPMRREVTWSEMPKRLVWPDATDRKRARGEQIRVFNACLDDVWRDGNATVVWDDFWYIVNILGMEKDAKQNLLNARSANSPQVICAQRGPGNRMKELFDQPTWLCFAKETDPDNLRSVGPPNSIEAGFIRNLDRYPFLIKNIRDGRMYRTTAPLLG